MPIPQLPGGGLNTLQDVISYVIRLERELRFLMEGGLDSSNMFEAGGWRVRSDSLASKDNMVGMSSGGSSPSSIRFWAGGTNPSTAPFRVQHDGSMYAENMTAVGGTITGALIRTSPTGTRLEMNSYGLFGYDSNNVLRIALLNQKNNYFPEFTVIDPLGNVTGVFASLANHTSTLLGPNNTGITLNNINYTGTDGVVIYSGDIGGSIVLKYLPSPNTEVYIDDGTTRYRVSRRYDTTDTAPVHDHGIPANTRLLYGHFDGTKWVIDGSVGWVPSGSHYHTL